MTDISTLGDLSPERVLVDGVEIEEELHSISYKHKRIRHFCMGAVEGGKAEFEFNNSTLTIGPLPMEKLIEKVERFKALYHGLQPSDRHAIVRLRNVQNEIGVDDLPISQPGGGTVRGPLGTTDVTAKATPEPAPAVRPSFLSRK